MEKPAEGGKKGETNWQMWEANKITMRQRRIIMTHVFGDAWNDFCSFRYQKTRTEAFLASGCGLTVTGVNDQTVIAEGMTNPVPLHAPGTPFDDIDYVKKAWSRHEGFFGTVVVAEQDSSASSSSSSSSSCSSSDSSDSD